jgi:hypothetical protein
MKLKRRVLYKGQYYDLISLEKPTSPYMILEKTEEDGQMPTIVVIMPQPDVPIKMGRGHTCEMRINDISVSRTHAVLKFQEN